MYYSDLFENCSSIVNKIPRKVLLSSADWTCLVFKHPISSAVGMQYMFTLKHNDMGLINEFFETNSASFRVVVPILRGQHH